MDHRRDDDGCSIFVLTEYAIHVLKTPDATTIGHPVVLYLYRSVEAMLIRLYRKAHFLIDCGHSRQLSWSWACPHAVLSAGEVVVGSTLPMLNALPVLRDRRAAAPDQFRAISV